MWYAEIFIFVSLTAIFMTMKNSTTVMAHYRAIVFLFISAVFAGPGFSQPDTLHLYYHAVHTKPADSTEARIDKWVKKLNGKPVDIDVVGYYHKPEFKQFAIDRCDELFLVLNRKARAL